MRTSYAIAAALSTLLPLAVSCSRDAPPASSPSPEVGAPSVAPAGEPVSPEEADAAAPTEHGAAAAPEAEPVEAPPTEEELRRDILARFPLHYGALELEDLTSGDGAPCAAGERASLRFELRLVDGTLVEEASAERPRRVTVGAGELIPGLERAIDGLRPGAVRRFSIPAHLAWGQRGVRAASDSETAWLVPPGATLRGEVELLGVER